MRLASRYFRSRARDGTRAWAFWTRPALAVLLLVTCAACPAPAQETNAIVILDGSNSMNARLPNDRATKHATVREALRNALPKLGPGIGMGLAAFGARRSNDCTDAEVIVPPSTDFERMNDALERFQPRGFSPVVLALRSAAKALPVAVGKASIVLILDDLASCRGEDPCTVASELKRQNPALTIHVVGLALKPADAQVLACVVRQTGGQLFNAVDGPGVAPAIEDALALARPVRVPAPVAAAPSSPPPRKVQEAPRTPSTPEIDLRGPGLHLTARLAEGKPPIAIPLRWRIFRQNDEEPSAAAEALVELVGPAFSRQLPNGRYLVEVTGGLASTRQSFEIISQGPTPVAVDLNVGLILITAPLAKGASTAGDAVLSVSSIAADPSARRALPLWIGRSGAQSLLVPAGSYRIAADAGIIRSELDVKVAKGETSPAEIVLDAGRLSVELTNVQSESGAERPQIIIEADDPDSPAGRRELHRTAGTRVDLTVPAGSYLLTARQGQIEVRERLQIRAGEQSSRSIALPLARVRLMSRIGASLPAGLLVGYRIERLDGVSRSSLRWGDGESVFDLSPGRYRFEARIGAQNAVAVREAEIRAGTETRIDLDTMAGGVKLRLAGARVGLGLGEVYWQIFDDRGAAVWRTNQPEPLMALVAGRYRVLAVSRERSYENTLDVRAGGSLIYEVGG